MQVFKVSYGGGPSLFQGGKAADCMMVGGEWNDEKFEFYAESVLRDDQFKPRAHEDDEWERIDEYDTHDELKAAILEQAVEKGIPADIFRFPNDMLSLGVKFP